METQWKDWRRQLVIEKKGGIEFKAIRRDVPYSLVMAFNVDYSGDAFSASLRLGPDAVGPTLADFTVTVGSYSGGFTNVTLSLSKAQVNALPSDDDFDGLAEVAFDLLHAPSGGDQQILLGGTMPILGKVTAGA